MNKQQKKNLDGALACLAAEALDARRTLKNAQGAPLMITHAIALEALAVEIRKSVELSFVATATLARIQGAPPAKPVAASEKREKAPHHPRAARESFRRNR